MGDGPDDKGWGPDELVRRAREQQESSEAWPLRSLSLRELQEPPDEPDWLLKRDGEGYLRTGLVTFLAAPGGTGKTMAALGLALAVASGRDWLRPRRTSTDTTPGFQVPTAGRVAYLAGEEAHEDLHRRIVAISRCMGLGNADRENLADRLLVAALAGKPTALVDEQGQDDPRWAQLEQRLRRDGEPWRLIVVDPLARFAGLEAETSAAHATRFVQLIERLAALPGRPAVLCLHHTRKGGGSLQTAVRGSSALVDAARAVMMLEPLREGDSDRGAPLQCSGGRGLRLTLAKSNHTAPHPPEFLVLDRGHSGAVRLASPDECRKLTSGLTGDRRKAPSAARDTSKPAHYAGLY